MENSEEIFHFLEDFSKRKPKTIPQELDEYLAYVARTGDPVYQWTLVKSLFKEKLLNVITDFYETTPGIEIPPYPNVDPFNYDIMKNSLLERLDSFTSAPFTVQRICELLTFPRKQYNRIDKFMRAVEKNILVVSTREPGAQRQPEENGEANEPIVNGSDNNSEYNVDVEMEDMSWKENNGQRQNSEPQPSSSDTHISVDDIEARLKAKEDTTMDTQEKITTDYESVTPPEINVAEEPLDNKPSDKPEDEPKLIPTDDKAEISLVKAPVEEAKVDIEMKTEVPTTLIIPEIKVDDAEMTEKKLIEQAKTEKQAENDKQVENGKQAENKTESESSSSETKSVTSPQPIEETPPLNEDTPQSIDESSSDSKDEPENKHIPEVITSSEESSSSSDNTDGSSSSPKTDEGHIDVQEESYQSESTSESTNDPKPIEEPTEELTPEVKPESSAPKIESDNYSITDVNSELPQPPADAPKVEQVKEVQETIEEKKVEAPASEESKKIEDVTPENDETNVESKES